MLQVVLKRKTSLSSTCGADNMSADPAVVHTCPVCSKDVKNVTYHFKSKGRTGDAFCNSCNSLFRWLTQPVLHAGEDLVRG